MVPDFDTVCYDWQALDGGQICLWLHAQPFQSAVRHIKGQILELPLEQLCIPTNYYDPNSITQFGHWTELRIQTISEVVQ